MIRGAIDCDGQIICKNIKTTQSNIVFGIYYKEITAANIDKLNINISDCINTTANVYCGHYVYR